VAAAAARHVAAATSEWFQTAEDVDDVASLDRLESTTLNFTLHHTDNEN